MQQARRVLFKALAFGFLVHVSCVASKAVTAKRVDASVCTDALAAFTRQHWYCSKLHFNEAKGLHFKCMGGDVSIHDGMVSRSGQLSSFLYTNTRTGAQGICDCDKPFGPACEGLR